MYLKPEFIKEACLHFRQYTSDWVVVPLVLAVNGVSAVDSRKLTDPGTDPFLRGYFSPTLIGEGEPAKSLLPSFKELEPQGNSVCPRKQQLWANKYSSRGYRDLRQRGLLNEKGAREYSLSADFRNELRMQLDGFQFEYLLAWLFAGKELPDSVQSWDELSAHFWGKYLGGPKPAEDYLPCFSPSGKFAPELLQVSQETQPLPTELREVLYPSPISFVAAAPVPVGNTSESSARDGEDVARVIEMLQDCGQVILQGPPGTGKSRLARLVANTVAPEVERVLQIQFHPGYSYEEFVAGLRPVVASEGDTSGSMKFEPTKGTFWRFMEKAKADRSNKYVLLIDEINRGNLARILGELLFLLEYRTVGNEALDATRRIATPLLKEPLEVPSNLWIIGTMNNFDRSIVAIDAATRRRFQYFSCTPNAAVIEDFYAEDKELLEIALRYFTESNRILREALDYADDMIGHSFFLSESMTPEKLRSRMEYAVLPVIREYLVGRPGEFASEIESLIA